MRRGPCIVSSCLAIPCVDDEHKAIIFEAPAGLDDGDQLHAAFIAGYDAAWMESAEGHNGEYASQRFTEELYTSAREAAYRKFRFHPDDPRSK